MNEIPRSGYGQINEDFPQTTPPPTRSGALPIYIPPQVISYSNEDILEQLGPIQAQGSPIKPPDTASSDPAGLWTNP